MDENRVRVMVGALVGSFSQWGVEVHRANTRPSFAARHQRGVSTAHCTVDVLSHVAMWMGFASKVHDGGDGAFDIIADANLIAGAAFWYRVAKRRKLDHS